MSRLVMACVSFLVLIGSGVSALDADTAFIDRLYEKHIPAYEKYDGYESVEQRVMTEFDSKKRLIASTTANVRATYYFYKKGTDEVKSYVKDGEVRPISEYTSRRSDPFYPIFDKDGKSRYTLTVIERQPSDNRTLAVIQVTPREITTRHMKGRIWVDVESLEQVKIAASMATLPFPLSRFNLTFYLTYLEDLVVVRSLSSDIVINVPFIKPNALFHTETAYLESQPILKK